MTHHAVVNKLRRCGQDLKQEASHVDGYDILSLVIFSKRRRGFVRSGEHLSLKQ